MVYMCYTLRAFKLCQIAVKCMGKEKSHCKRSTLLLVLLGQKLQANLPLKHVVTVARAMCNDLGYMQYKLT